MNSPTLEFLPQRPRDDKVSPDGWLFSLLPLFSIFQHCILRQYNSIDKDKYLIFIYIERSSHDDHFAPRADISRGARETEKRIRISELIN